MKAINPDGSDEYKYESDYCNIHREYLNPCIPNVRGIVKLAPIVTIPEQHERLNKFKKDQNKIKEWW